MTDPTPVPRDVVAGGAVLLDADEMAVGRAFARLTPIVDRLIDAPFDRAAYSDMQTYLDGEAWPAVAAFERITARGEHALATRVQQIQAAALAAPGTGGH
jgi:hypothetical protein